MSIQNLVSATLALDKKQNILDKLAENQSDPQIVDADEVK